ncbi:MAG TPA: response regulator [Anaeromyxobacteraceae bacterium]|nr:response regulator [Anaeromyxobacteraceae bacterium]
MPADENGSGMNATALRVLLVEDDDDNRELMAEVLVAAGCDVVAAATGAEGLKTLSERSVDVLVTDVGMPGMGGLEVARAAKQIAPTVPVVVVTGWAEREDIASARGKDVDAVLIKPVDPDALTNAVADVARGRPRT